jgi:hypothetical protein
MNKENNEKLPSEIKEADVKRVMENPIKWKKKRRKIKENYIEKLVNEKENRMMPS